MEIIVYVDEYGEREGDCEFRSIELSAEDKQNLFEMIGHSLGDGNIFKRRRVLTEEEYQTLAQFRDTHPDYIEYVKAKENVRRFEDDYGRL